MSELEIAAVVLGAAGIVLNLALAVSHRRRKASASASLADDCREFASDLEAFLAERQRGREELLRKLGVSPVDEATHLQETR